MGTILKNKNDLVCWFSIYERRGLELALWFGPSSLTFSFIYFPLMVDSQTFYKLLWAVSAIYQFFLKVPCVQIKTPILEPSPIKSDAFLYDANISFFMCSKFSVLILSHYEK